METSVSALDRVQHRPPDSTPSRWLRTLALVALVGVGLWFAFAWIRGGDTAEDTDLLFRLSVAASEFRPEVPAQNGDDASAWVMETYGWPIIVPDLPDLQLVGAGETMISRPSSTNDDDAWVSPTFRYAGSGAERVVLFAYDYAQLDRATEWLQLPQGVYGRLAEETPFDTRRLDATGDYALTWRRRAVVYTAITDNEAIVERLSEALARPVPL